MTDTTKSRWVNLCRLAEASGASLDPEDFIPELAAFLHPSVFWREGRVRAAYDLSLLVAGTSPRELCALWWEVASRLDSHCFFSSIQRDRFWASYLETQEIIVYQRMTPCIIGVFVRHGRAPQPVYDIEKMATMLAGDMHISRKMEPARQNEFLWDYLQRNLMSNKSPVMPAYQL